ncbi:hypothetical protein EJ02DRAFT_478109 [Clathrospora elynae]|uniref:Uncharacterized protein n=1 Tax=Clathrospora elynae TaxID=706981 RepID=A0A6A5T2Y8_9PLEO|nr:hypothetical protein EJ02DRAFT_478109 [Clathrospora elynae]
MTNNPPQYVLDRMSDGRSAGWEHLRRAIDRVKPELHCFGRIHLACPLKGYEAHRLNYDGARELDGDMESTSSVLHDWVGKNRAHKKGFTRLTPGSAEDSRSSNKTL